MIIPAGADQMTDEELARVYLEEGIAESEEEAQVLVDAARGRLGPLD